MKPKLIGEIIHYFPKPKVAVVKIKNPLALGDEVRVQGGKETDFTQKIESMEVDFKKIKKAKKGDEVGIKLKEKVREGYKIYQE